jgi:hypothetical protein
MIAYSAKCPNCYNECVEYRDKSDEPKEKPTYTVVITQKTTFVVNAESEEEAKIAALNGNGRNIKTTINSNVYLE